MIVTGYPHKPKAKKMLSAFLGDGRGRLLPYASSLAEGPAAFCGIGEPMMHLWRQALREQRDYYYLENGYFGYGVYESCTRNAMQATGLDGRPDYRRFKSLNVRIRPWRKDGRTIVICLQSERWFSLVYGLDRADWIDHVTATIRQHSDREIIVRQKPHPVQECDLFFHLEHAFTVVVQDSKAAIQAICYGVPAFVLAPCAASLMASDDLLQIETPRYPDGREEWAARLSSQQWTVHEMRTGQCWREVHEMNLQPEAVG